MPTTQVDDGLDEFVKNYRAKNPSGTDDDLDAFVKNFKSAPSTLPASFSGFDADRTTQTPDTLPKDFDGFDADGPGQTVAAPKTPAPAQPVSTIGPSTHTVLDSVRRMFGAGAPQGSVMANAMDQTGTKDNLRLLAPEQLMTESQQQRHPIATGVGEVAGGLTSPDSLMLLAGTAGAGQLAGPAGQTVKQLLAAGFTSQMLTSAIQQVPEVAKAIQSGDSYNAKRLMTHLALTTAMAGGAAHGVFDEPKPLTVPKGTVSAPLDSDFAEQPRVSSGTAAGQAQPGADDLDSFVAQYKNPPAPQNPLAGKPAPEGHIGPLAEPLAPEHPNTLKAQTAALANGTNGVVYFPKGTETIPAPPENASVTVVPGDKAGAGTYYHTPDVTPQQIQSSVADGTFGKLLGNHQTKEEAIAGQAPAAIVARDENGTEIKASLVDSADPHVVAAQAATFQRQFPNAQITVESPDDVVADRLKASTGAITPQVDMPEYYRHPVTGENVRLTPDELDSGALALYGKENYRDLTPSQKQNLIKFATPKTKGLSIDAQSVAGGEKTSQPPLSEQTPASYAQSLHNTADQVEPYNAPIAHALRSIAQGEPQSMPELRQFVANFIDDPKEKAKLSQILDSDNQNVSSSGSLPSSLHETADQVERHNAPIADALRSIANGEPQSRGELQRFVENFIDDPKAKADLSRILDADNQKASTEPVSSEHPLDQFVREYQPSKSLAEHFETLRGLSAEIGDRDPELSHALTQMASGGIRGLEIFRKYVDENVTDGAQSKELFRLIDAAESEARRFKSKIGDRVDVTGDGRLKGRNAEVTQVTDSGVYAREAEGKRISFVRNGDFRPEERTEARAASAVRELVGGARGAYDPNVSYSGLDPKLIKFLIPEAVRDRIGEESHKVAMSRSLQKGLYELDSQAAADMLRARKVLRDSPGTPADLEQIYHHLEDKSVRLSAPQREILAKYVQPIVDATREAYRKVSGGASPANEHVHRIAMGKGNTLDRILGGEGKLTAGNTLSGSAPGLKSRTMMALEDEAGNRRVVSVKGGKVTGWHDGEPEELGKIRGQASVGMKTRQEILDREAAPLQRELDNLIAEHRTLTATKGRSQASAVRIENIEERQAELRQDLQDIYRKDDGGFYSESELKGRKFVDNDGKEWELGQATTKEIEAQTNVKYYKNALASTVLDFLQQRRAERAYDFLESYKSSPEFGQVAVKTDAGLSPKGWRTTDLPQFRGYSFEPHTAEVLDWYAKRMKSEGPGVYEKVGNFLRTAIFYNFLVHTPNIANHWVIQRGISGLSPTGWGRVLRTGARAIDAVTHQNQDFLDALDQGAPLQSQRLESDATTKLVMERMGKELEANQGYAGKIASALGYANPAKLVRAVYNFSAKATWVTNDVAMLQAAYEHMEKTGDDFRTSMDDVAKHIPDYRLPTRIFDSKALGKLMGNPNLTMFSAYHYGALRSYGEMAKSLVDDSLPNAERVKALDRLAMLGLVTFVAYPVLDQLAKKLTGDKTAEFRRAGASTFVDNMVKLARGQKTPSEVAQTVATPAPLTKAIVQAAANRDFRTGREIVDWHAPAKTIAKQAGRYVADQVSPVSQAGRIAEGRQSVGDFAAGLVGIKTKVATPALALARKYASAGAGSSAPDQDTLERSYLRRQYEDDLRSGKISKQQVAQDRAAGKITFQDQANILHRVARTPLQNAVSHLTAEQAVNVWDQASPQEQTEIRPLLRGKLESLGNLPADRRASVRARILSALGTAPSVPRTPPNAGRNAS